MPGPTSLTPNIGLQVPGLNQPNWQVPINYDLNLLDLIFGGAVQVPGLSVVNLVAVNLTVTNFTLPGFGGLLAAAAVDELPSKTSPTVYVLSHPLAVMTGLFLNGSRLSVFNTPPDYSVGTDHVTITLANPTVSTDILEAVYFKSS